MRQKIPFITTYTKYKYDANGFDINGKHEDTNEIYDTNGFDINEKHKDTKNKYNPNGFDIKDAHKDTRYRYNPNGFNIKGIHKYTKNKYDSLGFDINGINKDTKNKYDPDRYDINGINKDTGTFLNRGNLATDDICYNINWLKNEDDFLELYDKIIKNGEFTETVNKKVISSKIFKDFAEDVLNGNFKNNNKNEIYKKRLDGVENDLDK